MWTTIKAAATKLWRTLSNNDVFYAFVLCFVFAIVSAVVGYFIGAFTSIGAFTGAAFAGFCTLVASSGIVLTIVIWDKYDPNA